MDNKAIIEGHLQELAQARYTEAGAKQAMDKLIEDVKRMPVYQAFEENRKLAQSEAENQRIAIEKLALEQYKSDETKRPHEFVEVRLMQKSSTSSDKQKLYTWVKENMPLALVVDEKAVITAAKAKDSRIPDFIVRITSEPAVYIKQDLSELIKEVK